MKKLYLFGNLKMNKPTCDLTEYLKKLSKIAKSSENVVCVSLPYPYLGLAQKLLKKSKVLYGAENCHYEPKGAFTGEVSVPMLKEFGCNTCIVGHSERRTYDNETNEKVNLKLKALLKESMTPIMCFGETKDERDKALTKKVIKTQLSEGLVDLTANEIKKIVFAYEPVWAIGTGVSATSKQAEEMAKFIKEYLAKEYDLTVGEIVLLYGGSLNAENAQDILSKTHIDGGLIGGACLDVNKYEKIINTVVEE